MLTSTPTSDEGQSDMALRMKKWRHPTNMDEVRIYVNGFDGDQTSPFFTKDGIKAKLNIPKEVKNPERMTREIDSFLYEEYSLQLDGLEWSDVVREVGW